MMQTVGIFVFDEVEVLDFAGPFEVFSVASQLHNFKLFDVKLIAEKREPTITVNGLSINAHFCVEDAPPIDILIIAGGSGTRKLLDNEVTLRWIDKMIVSAEISISICSGSRVLGKLGYLDKLAYCTHAEVYPHMVELVPNGIPQHTKRFIQSAPNLYTSGGISAGIDLSFHVLEKLHGKEVAGATAQYMEYDTRTICQLSYD